MFIIQLIQLVPVHLIRKECILRLIYFKLIYLYGLKDANIKTRVDMQNGTELYLIHVTLKY